MLTQQLHGERREATRTNEYWVIVTQIQQWWRLSQQVEKNGEVEALLWKSEAFCEPPYEEHPQNFKRAASKKMKDGILTSRKNGSWLSHKLPVTLCKSFGDSFKTLDIESVLKAFVEADWAPTLVPSNIGGCVEGGPTQYAKVGLQRKSIL